jgi:alpha-galactosidase
VRDCLQRFVAMVVMAGAVGLPGVDPAAETVPLGSLDLTKMSAGWGAPQIDRNVVGKAISIGGRQFTHGVGTHANSVLHVDLDGRVERFTAFVGVDDETQGKGTVSFRIYGDGRRLLDSGVIKGHDPAKRVDVPLRGVKHLILLVTGAGDGVDFDHADWADAVFSVTGERPKAVDVPVVKEAPVMLTPPPGAEPRINGPRVYGCRPGRPFLYRIPCTGKRPITFAADNLPEDLTLDQAAGIIGGRAPRRPGEYTVTLKAENSHGRTKRDFKIVVGDRLALTPPMGWNSWYIHYYRVTDRHLREAADAMICSGMAEFGYQYVNVDDCWMVKPGAKDPKIGGPPRDAQGAIRSNQYFPDMKALCNYIHSKGLKAGLYTSPGPLTCQGYAGSYQHEESDAKQFAAWGFDFLKYDWCSYGRVAGGTTLEHLQRPYQKMGELLKRLDRDIVFNLCQYGMGNVWTWGGEVGGHCWRTTGDLGLQRGDLLPGFYRIGLSNARHWQYAKPGQWNDPDYILIGRVGDAHKQGEGHPTPLTPHEQYSYMSLWCLMAAPLIFSGDMTKLDAFTLNVLCNAEVIAVDQDTLGHQGKIVRQTDEALVMAKPLEDGCLAVGLFNLGEFPQEISVTWPELGLHGRQSVRDLWRQRDLGVRDGRYTATVPRHGVALVRIRPTQ